MASKEARALVAKHIQENPDILKEIARPLQVHHEELDILLRQNMIHFVSAFESTFAALDTEKKRMIKHMYWESQEKKNCQVVGMKLYVDGSTVGRWRNSILNEVADRMGLR